MSQVSPIPPGFHSLTPYLVIKGAAAALDFYARAFGAVERYRLPGNGPDAIGHAEMTFGNSILMLADEDVCSQAKSPQTLGGSTSTLAFYVADCDALFQQAVAAGATVVEPLEDKFYGDRGGIVQDPFGFLWSLMTHKEDLSAEEIDRRMKEMFSPPAV